jgi:hypothetical protein
MLLGSDDQGSCEARLASWKGEHVVVDVDELTDSESRRTGVVYVSSKGVYACRGEEHLAEVNRRVPNFPRQVPEG